MAGQREQVDGDVIMINQQHVYSKAADALPPTTSTPVGASSRSCDQPLIYDMIASAVCLRGKHKSTSPLLNARAHQGYHHHPLNPLSPTTHCKKCPPTQVLSSAVQTEDLSKDIPLVKVNEFYVNLDFLCFRRRCC